MIHLWLREMQASASVASYLKHQNRLLRTEDDPEGGPTEQLTEV